MDGDQLISLRDKIFQDIEPLLIDSAQNGVEKFDLLMRVIRGGNASSNLYTMAYECAKTIDDKSDRLDALLSLVDEIDIDINQVGDRQSAKIENNPEGQSVENQPQNF